MHLSAHIINSNNNNNSNKQISIAPYASYRGAKVMAILYIIRITDVSSAR